MKWFLFATSNDQNTFAKDLSVLGGLVGAYEAERNLQEKWTKERAVKDAEKVAREKERGW